MSNKLSHTLLNKHLVFIASLPAVLGGTVLLPGCAGTPTQASLGENVDDSVITARVKDDIRLKGTR